MAQEEQVLVIERKVFERVGAFNGLVFDVDRYLSEIFAPSIPRFMPRSKAEKDTNYKQLIPYVIMSNGTRITPDPDYISVLRDELFVIDNTLTFKIPHIDLSWSRLIAFTNVQGRYINNSTNPCTMNATQCTGQFIHIEQEKSKLRQDFIGWLKMYEALSNTFPENPVSTGDFVEIKKESILIYPNPSQEFLYIKASNPLTVSIFNAIGQCIFHESYTTDQVEIDLVRHLPGLYHVRIIDSEGVTTQKLLLK